MKLKPNFVEWASKRYKYSEFLQILCQQSYETQFYLWYAKAGKRKQKDSFGITLDYPWDFQKTIKDWEIQCVQVNDSCHDRKDTKA